MLMMCQYTNKLNIPWQPGNHPHMTNYPENSKSTRKRNDFSPLFTAPHKNTKTDVFILLKCLQEDKIQSRHKQWTNCHKHERGISDVPFVTSQEEENIPKYRSRILFFFVLLIVPLGPTFLSNVGMEGNEGTHVHVGCANHVYHPHSKESHIWNCVRKADKSVLVAAKWWTRVFSGERNSLDDGRRFCVFAASQVLKGIESIEDWMRAN